MTRYLFRRLLALIPVLLGVSILVFLILHLTPGNPAEVVAGPDAPPETIAAIEKELGLDKPLYVQYFTWISKVLRGDLGKSLRSKQPVAAEIRRTFPVTLQLTVVALALAVIVSIPMGVVSAVRKDTWVDNLVRLLSFLGISVPVFAVGLLLMWVFAYKLRWLPVSGFKPLTTVNGWVHIILPALTLGAPTVATVARLTRSSILETLTADYIRTARAKGLRGSAVVYRHALRNALLPVVTVLGLQFGYLLGGAVVTETIFSIPGVGRLSVQAIQTRDFPIVQGAVLVVAYAFVVINLLVDLLYTIIDPRIRYE
ncbi:MAG: ABC transporter permease [Clostridiales bacterium]|nr:ABC transporter permease [Clostridiales bacterium]